jgi:hypothetical protein
VSGVFVTALVNVILIAWIARITMETPCTNVFGRMVVVAHF